MTAILVTGLLVVVAGTAVLLLALRRGTQADEDRAAAWDASRARFAAVVDVAFREVGRG